MPDESDRIFYDTAKAVNAYLVTGNLKHYPEETQFEKNTASFNRLINKTTFMKILLHGEVVGFFSFDISLRVKSSRKKMMNRL